MPASTDELKDPVIDFYLKNYCFNSVKVEEATISSLISHL